MASNLKSNDTQFEDFQDDDNFESPPVKSASIFSKFREMISQYKSINALTRYLIHIIAVIVIAGVLVAAYEIIT